MPGCGPCQYEVLDLLSTARQQHCQDGGGDDPAGCWSVSYTGCWIECHTHKEATYMHGLHDRRADVGCGSQVCSWQEPSIRPSANCSSRCQARGSTVRSVASVRTLPDRAPPRPPAHGRLPSSAICWYTQQGRMSSSAAYCLMRNPPLSRVPGARVQETHLHDSSERIRAVAVPPVHHRHGSMAPKVLLASMQLAPIKSICIRSRASLAAITIRSFNSRCTPFRVCADYGTCSSAPSCRQQRASARKAVSSSGADALQPLLAEVKEVTGAPSQSDAHPDDNGLEGQSASPDLPQETQPNAVHHVPYHPAMRDDEYDKGADHLHRNYSLQRPAALAVRSQPWCRRLHHQQTVGHSWTAVKSA